MSELAKIQAEVEKIGNGFEEFKKAHAAELKEIRERGAPSAETTEKLTRLDAVLTAAEEAKSAAERALAAAKQFKSNPANDPDRPELREYKAALQNWLVTGKGEETFESKRFEAAKAIYGESKARTLSTLSDPDGGYLVTFDLDPEFHRDVVETSPMRQLARIQQTTRNYVKGRRRVARAGFGGFAGETESRAKTDTPRLGEWRIDVHEQFAYPEVTQEELEDAADVERWLMEEVGPEFGYSEATAFFEGTGTGQPRGFLTYPSTDPGNGAFIATKTCATQDTISGSDLIDLQTELKEEYQRQAEWCLTRYTLGAIRKISSPANDGGYLWQPGLQAGVPSLILGRPYKLAAPKLTGTGDMHSVGSSSGIDSTTNPIVAYGDWKKGYRIVDRLGITTLRDPYTNKPYIGFYMRRRVGGDVVRFEAIKLLLNKD